MKKIVIIIGILFLSLNKGFAINAQTYKAQRQMNSDVVNKLSLTKSVATALSFEKKLNLLSQRYYGHVQSCTPFKFAQEVNLFGLSFDFSVNINGWDNDNKCEYVLTGKINSLGEDVKEIFDVNVSDEIISQFDPIIKCRFDNAQLVLISDVLKESGKTEDEKVVRRILSNKLATRKMSQKEQQLLSYVLDGKTCTLENSQELMEKFSQTNEK